MALPGGGGSALGALASIPGDTALQAALMAAIVAAGGVGVVNVPFTAPQFQAMNVTPVAAIPAVALFVPMILSVQIQWTVTAGGTVGGNWEIRFSNGQTVNIGALSRNGNIANNFSFYSTPNAQTFGAGVVPIGASVSIGASAASTATATGMASLVYRMVPQP